MKEFENNALDEAKNAARKYQAKKKEIEGQISLKEAQIEALNRELAEVSEMFSEKVKAYYELLMNVKKGDIIECDGEKFRFVRFAELSKDPIVNEKLKSGKWGKRERQLWAYDWEKKETMKWSIKI